jgi:hypothetical protein
MTMKNIEWWRGTANHMWRTYFALERDGFKWETLSEPNRKFYAICHHLFTKKFVKTDQDILRYYFTSRWGDDIYAVEDYSLKNNIPVKVIWMVIRRANRMVMEECGFLERKEDAQDE